MANKENVFDQRAQEAGLPVDEYLRSLLAEHGTAEKIASALGVSRQWLYEYMRTEGLVFARTVTVVRK